VVREDLLGLLLAAEDAETGERMTDGQVRDEIFTFFMSGYETTATGISWATYLLAEPPEVVARMVDELGEVTGGGQLRFTDLPRLGYGRRVIDEAFRLYPAFPIYFRNAVESDQLGPYRLPANAKIVISPHVTHRAPEFWDDPEKFDPDRFGPDRFDARARRAYYPFYLGQGMSGVVGGVVVDRFGVLGLPLVSAAFGAAALALLGVSLLRFPRVSLRRRVVV
jgi:cytochrome P450